MPGCPLYSRPGVHKPTNLRYDLLLYVRPGAFDRAEDAIGNKLSRIHGHYVTYQWPCRHLLSFSHIQMKHNDLGISDVCI